MVEILLCNTGSGHYGQFCYVWVFDDSQYKNHIIDSSVTLTEKKYEYQYSTLYHWNGNISCKGVNVSYNEVFSTSGIYINNPSISYISFSSFRNNKATGSDSYSSICIYCYSKTHQMTNTNIIENNPQGSSFGIIYTRNLAILTMKHCSVFGNCNNDIGKVFDADSGSITCDNCSIGSDQKGSFTTLNTASESFINYYEYLELDECKRGLDSWGTLYPIMPTPKQTPEQTLSNVSFKFIQTMKQIIVFMWFLWFAHEIS